MSWETYRNTYCKNNAIKFNFMQVNFADIALPINLGKFRISTWNAVQFGLIRLKRNAIIPHFGGGVFRLTTCHSENLHLTAPRQIWHSGCRISAATTLIVVSHSVLVRFKQLLGLRNRRSITIFQCFCLHCIVNRFDALTRVHRYLPKLYIQHRGRCDHFSSIRITWTPLHSHSYHMDTTVKSR